MTPEPPPEDEQRTSIELLRASFSGPLPPPAMLGLYEEVLPGSADRILRMAEQRAAHENQVELEDAKRARLGVIAGAALAFAMLVVAGAAIAVGQPVVGGVIAGAEIVSLVGIFIYGTRPRT